MGRWLDILFPPRADEVALRGVSNDAFIALIAPRMTLKTHPGTVTLLPFSVVPVRAVLHEAKYHGSEKAFALLSAVLAEYLRDADEAGRTTPSVSLVPMPLGTQRRKERGYNQVEEIANRTLRELDGITIDTTLLARTRETASQVSLPRKKREENMRGAFGTTRLADSASTYILLDDVLTTGATLQAAIDTLAAAGAVHIIPLALAH
ncbi:ComF family protein [Patescibacteria group bacterium]|nr:ComF family protein [Patescibacteria group bacterium]MDE2021313.1 ComF family protein [Patescibacteria group bacterium]MDE2173023.1 ComF family protein [Patescibacteria group bacterium]